MPSLISRPGLPDPDLVSIAMPVYNGAKTVMAAVRSLLGQTYPHWEVLLLDDGSTDGTGRLLDAFSDPRIRIFTDSVNRGRPYRLNQALALARGAYFTRLDADDLAFPDRLEKQVAFLKSHPEIDLVGSAMMMFRGAGEVLGFEDTASAHEDITRRPWARIRMAGATMMGRTDWFLRFGFDLAAKRAEDQELLLRALSLSRYANLPDMLYAYRVDHFSVRTNVMNRLHFARVLLRESSRQQKPLLFAGAILQLAKCGADLLTFGTGSDEWTRWRGWRPLSSMQQQSWQTLLHSTEREKTCVVSQAS